jgi:hypothetical protein
VREVVVRWTRRWCRDPEFLDTPVSGPCCLVVGLIKTRAAAGACGRLRRSGGRLTACRLCATIGLG